MHINKMSDLLEPLSPIANLSLSSPHRVLIVGCAYGGISAVVNLLDLAQGKPRDTVYPTPDMAGKKSKQGVEITVIDERDGYCKCLRGKRRTRKQSSAPSNRMQSIPSELPSRT